MGETTTSAWCYKLGDNGVRARWRRCRPARSGVGQGAAVQGTGVARVVGGHRRGREGQCRARVRGMEEDRMKFGVSRRYLKSRLRVRNSRRRADQADGDYVIPSASWPSRRKLKKLPRACCLK